MFGVRNRADAYKKVGVETGVSTASPHQLIVMLYDGALMALSKAIAAFEAEDVAARGASLSKAIEIIDNGLRASLDMKAGDGEMSARLDALYEYMCDRLLHANLRADPAPVKEVMGLLGSLREAWVQIDPMHQQQQHAGA